jgi:hypothetical protein
MKNRCPSPYLPAAGDTALPVARRNGFSAGEHRRAFHSIGGLLKRHRAGRRSRLAFAAIAPPGAALGRDGGGAQAAGAFEYGLARILNVAQNTCRTSIAAGPDKRNLSPTDLRRLVGTAYDDATTKPFQ